MTRAIARLGILTAALIGFASVSPAYYYFLHFDTQSGSFRPIPEKFDLSALPNQTLQYYVSEQGPSQLAPGDSFDSVLSQLRLAAQVWNGVPTSGLRLAFGGLFLPGTPQATPHVEVIFDDVPGLLAMGGPTSRSEMVKTPDGSFVPIARSVLVLNRDLSKRPSFTEGFFMTVVHELGHTLGLQHSFASSTMSTEVTRATTKAAPLGADDVAAISGLYPTAAFALQTGTIAGRVTMGGQPVHMASVVALASGRDAVSALTNPDGTYSIAGLPAGQYYVYVHPLPPSAQSDLGPAETVLPLNTDQQPIPASAPFGTKFYPGVGSHWDAGTVAVAAGAATDKIDFDVQPVGSVRLYGVTTYGFPGQVPVKPAFLNMDRPSRWFFVATAYSNGLTDGGQPLPGLTAGVVGGTAAVQALKAYAPATAYLETDFNLPIFTAGGPRHVVFNWNDYMYVLPSAFIVAEHQPPSIASVTPATGDSGQRIAVLQGANLGANTRFLFDGLPARVVRATPDGITVVPPAGSSSHVAMVTALNPDGQSSLFLTQTPPAYTYDPSDAPAISLSSNAVPAGSEAMIEIAGTNTAFDQNETVVGFGSSDVFVRRIAVAGPNLLRVQVAVSPSAAPQFTTVTVVTGFQTATLAHGFQILPQDSDRSWLSPEILNPDTRKPVVYPGSKASLFVANASFASAPQVTVNGIASPAVSVDQNRLIFVIPGTVSPGPAVVTVQAGDKALSALIPVDFTPPHIVAIMSGANVVNAAQALRAGDVLTVIFSGAGDPALPLSADRFHLVLGGIEHVAVGAAVPVQQAGVYQVQFVLSPKLPANQKVTGVLTVDGRESETLTLTIG